MRAYMYLYASTITFLSGEVFLALFPFSFKLCVAKRICGNGKRIKKNYVLNTKQTSFVIFGGKNIHILCTERIETVSQS